MRLLTPARRRIAVFAAVGGVCFIVQLVLLTAVVHLGISRPVADAIGFAASAQLNFALSTRFTWGDRQPAGRRDTSARWLAYNATALVSLGCNSVVFTASYQAIGTTVAALLGVLAGTTVVYLTCNFLVFRVRKSAARAAMGGEPQLAGGPQTAGETRLADESGVAR
jgi:putative flippase GtrA